MKLISPEVAIISTDGCNGRYYLTGAWDAIEQACILIIVKRMLCRPYRLHFSMNTRKWQPRRVIITKEVISFAFVGQETELDYIPLDEVEFIKEMKDIVVDSKAVHIIESEGKETFALQIATVKDGHNSGRPYYLQVLDRQSLTEIMQLLIRNSKAARKLAQAHTTFRRFQYAVRKAYDSQAFQIFVAILISAVCRVFMFFNFAQ
jgi:hypothetical protein